jgi:transposase
MRPKGTPKELERLRLKAVKAVVEKGERQVDVARIFQIGQPTLCNWIARYREDPDSLLAKPIPGRTPALSASHLKELSEYLKLGPQAFGWTTDLWTSKRVRDLIQLKFGISFHKDHVFKILTEKMQWSFQRPEKVARERDPAKVAKWLEETLPEIKKKRRTRVRP